jgi:hypothetical protein
MKSVGSLEDTDIDVGVEVAMKPPPGRPAVGAAGSIAICSRNRGVV